MTTDNRTNEKIETRKCSNQACPLRRAHSGPCAPSDWKPGAPSEAQVEAALAAHEAHKGAWVDEFREMVCPECGWCYMTEHERRSGNKPSNEVVYARVDAHRMRAALVAAAGAARRG